VRRAGQATVALLLACMAALAAAPMAVADGSIPLWPVNSFTLLAAGFVVVLVVLVVSAAILARVSRAERERRLDTQYETRLAERGTDAEELAPSDRTMCDPSSTPQQGGRR
jgi:heme/copper-type cytochrome/quinol oxidase subunit 2